MVGDYYVIRAKYFTRRYTALIKNIILFNRNKDIKIYLIILLPNVILENKIKIYLIIS